MVRKKKTTAKDNYGHPFMNKDMSHIVLKLVLLRRIEQGEVYSYAMVKELGNSKFSFFLKKYCLDVKNDTYNTLKALEKSGYIKVDSRIENGRLKKYYYITARGKNAIKNSKLLFMKNMKELMKIIG
jgi:DNA-binding PadR family transcriptional regulator